MSQLTTALLEVLNQVLANRGLLPVRDGGELAPRLAAHPDPVFAYEGVERGVPRNTDRGAQAEECRAKKARRLKNMPLCDATQSVYFLSPTADGRQHDRKLADEYALHLPADSVRRQDLGLLGHAPAGVVAEMPHKKPPKRESAFSQKLYNHWLSPLRAVLEHARSGLKRLRMGADTLRLRSGRVRDTVLVVACGLHNLRVRSPHRAYLAQAPAKLPT